jgi:hypothetical protein
VVDNHNQSFFGQSTGMFVQSSSKHEPFIFLQFIKKKGDGSWEKPTLREGKRVKFGLEEIVMILNVLKKKSKAWSTVHIFKDEKTPISVKWEGEQKLWINVGSYPKMLSDPQVEIMKLLMDHILQEKIEFATIRNSDRERKENNSPGIQETPELKKQTVKPTIEIVEEINSKDDVTAVQGTITGETEKAVLLKLENGSENWFPKSTIKSEYSPEQVGSQRFLIDSWIIEKNKIAV